MIHNEYEQAKRRLEESRRAGVELVEIAYQAQMRSLEMVWNLLGRPRRQLSPLQGTRDGRSRRARANPSAAGAAQATAGGEVEEELRRIYPQLPETFGRRDINALLGYEPERAGLYRILAELSTKGALVIVKPALGRTPAVYRKIAADFPPGD